MGELLVLDLSDRGVPVWHFNAILPSVTFYRPTRIVDTNRGLKDGLNALSIAGLFEVYDELVCIKEKSKRAHRVWVIPSPEPAINDLVLRAVLYNLVGTVYSVKLRRNDEGTETCIRLHELFSLGMHRRDIDSLDIEATAEAMTAYADAEDGDR